MTRKQGFGPKQQTRPGVLIDQLLMVWTHEGENHIAEQYERALCGVDVTGGTRADIPPDFGTDKGDCAACDAAFKRLNEEAKDGA